MKVKEVHSQPSDSPLACRFCSAEFSYLQQTVVSPIKTSPVPIPNCKERVGKMNSNPIHIVVFANAAADVFVAVVFIIVSLMIIVILLSL
jgi:hypothetical protein